MIGKLIIIGIIVILLIILIPNSSKLFQNMPLFDTVKEKIDHATSDKYVINASKSTIKTMNEKLGTNSSDFSTSTNSSPSNNIVSNVYQLPSKYVNQQNYTGQVFERTGNICEISVPAMAQAVNGKTELTHILQLSQCSLNVGDLVKVTMLTAKSDAPPVNLSSALNIIPYSKNKYSSLPILPDYYNVIKLNTVTQGNNTILNFEDSSGQTKSVIITMKNSDKILFTGTFYSSKFITEIKDIPNTTYIIDMTIDNTVYGILHASAYTPPSKTQNSTITGILSQ